METKAEMLVEQCIDILQEKDMSCILTSVSNTGYPYAAVIKPVCGLGIDTVYFILENDATLVKNFERNTKGSITYYSGDNSVHLMGDVSVISAERLCQDVTDTHLFSTSLADGCVLLKFSTHESYIHIGEGNYDLQI